MNFFLVKLFNALKYNALIRIIAVKPCHGLAWKPHAGSVDRW